MTPLKITENREPPNARRVVETGATLLLMLFAFFFTFKTGERGLFPLDQSFVFDGSYRIATGQIPYKDFLFAHGPLVIFLTAACFKLFGVTYYSYILGAAVVNSCAVLCSIVVVKKIFPTFRPLPYLSGIITAIWFYPPFGTPWADQTSFFFALLAITTLLFFLSNGKQSLLLLAGLLAFLSFLGKQNAGSIVFMVYGALLFLYPQWNPKKSFNKLLIFLAGFFFGATLFTIWLGMYSDIFTFFKHFALIPITSGRTTRGLLMFAQAFLWSGPYSLLPRLFVLLSCFLSAYALFQHRTDYKFGETRSLNVILAAILVLSLALYQLLYLYTTYNDPENTFPFLGIIFSLSIGILLQLLSNSPIPRHLYKSCLHTIITPTLILITGYICMQGAYIGLFRKVQDMFPHHPREFLGFKEEVLKPLKWINPTMMYDTEIKKSEFESLFYYLKNQEKNFFIFPDFTIFYGLLGRPSPQPLVWFDKGLTFSPEQIPDLDTKITNSLRDNDTEIVILEKKSSLGTYKRLNDFPKLKSYITTDFSKTQDIGIFQIYSKKDTPTHTTYKTD